MTPTLRRTFQQLREQGGVIRFQGLVFEKSGKKHSHTYRIVQDICKAKEIENFIFHDLRHCAVTNLADAGVDTETIMKIVGHSSVEMFLRYRTIKAEKLDDAMSRLNTLITRRVSPASLLYARFTPATFNYPNWTCEGRVIPISMFSHYQY